MTNIHYSTRFELNGDMIFTAVAITDDSPEIAQVKVEVTMKNTTGKSSEEVLVQALGLLAA
jgi:hypothetical protein